MKFRILLFAIFALFACEITLAQDYGGNMSYAPPSPNAFNLLSFANTSVNQHTGTAAISLPIMEIPGRRLSVPVSLDYHASGIKVQDMASWVGLGWSLNAGGVITRIVRGLPDENDNGFCGKNDRGEQVDDTYTNGYLSSVNANSWDSEPDVFYFNFLGKTGKFFLGADGRPVLLPYQNLTIHRGICNDNNGDGSWTLIDESGTQYIFGKTTDSKETSTYTAPNEINMTFISA